MAGIAGMKMAIDQLGFVNFLLISVLSTFALISCFFAWFAIERWWLRRSSGAGEEQPLLASESDTDSIVRRILHQQP